MIIRGLTLWRPWDRAMRDLGKCIENREYPPPPHLIGHLVALHSGKKWDAAGAEVIAEITGRLLRPDECPESAIACVGRLAGYIPTDEESEPRPGWIVSGEQRRWLFGLYGWIIADRVAIDPVACRGAQGLWRLPPEVEAEVLRRYEAARRTHHE